MIKLKDGVWLQRRVYVKRFRVPCFWATPWKHFHVHFYMLLATGRRENHGPRVFFCIARSEKRVIYMLFVSLGRHNVVKMHSKSHKNEDMKMIYGAANGKKHVKNSTCSSSGVQ